MNERMKRLQKTLAENSIDSAVFATSSALQYLLDDTNYAWQRTMYTGEYPDSALKSRGHFLNMPDCLLVLPASGEPVLLMTYRRAEDMKHIPIRQEITYFTQFPLMLGEILPANGTVAVGECCYEKVGEYIDSLGTGIKIVSGEEYVQKMRTVKDAGEIEKMRRVATFTDKCMEYVAARLKPGISRMEVENLICGYGRDHGLTDLSFDPAAIFVKTGDPKSFDLANCGNPHEKLEKGMSVGFDYGFVMDGYCSDYGRSFYCGKAPKELTEGYKVLNEAQLFLLDQIKPGVPMNLCFNTIEKKMDELGGYGKYLRKYGDFGMIGHQIGIDTHELPWVHDNLTCTFEPGMVMCIEPKLWWPGKCYLRCEDMVLVTETGAESLTKFDRSIFELE